MYDIAIIGSGPGGYVAAIRASQLGAKVALIEKGFIGGVCLNKGCIPTKTIIASANKYKEIKKLNKFGISVENPLFDYEKIFDRKELIVSQIRKNLTKLIKSKDIDIIEGTASIADKNTLKVISESGNEIVEFKNLIISTGSRPISFAGMQIDNEFIFDTNGILSLKELPQNILIVGSGANGLEWARIASSFGKNAVVVELAPKICPMFDEEISDRIERLFKRDKIVFYTGTKIENIKGRGVFLSNGVNLKPDIILLTAGREPNSEMAGLENLKIEKNGKYIKIDNNLKTNIDNVYAIGDVTGILPLAHCASHQGIKAVEYILENKAANINYNAIPKIIWGNPEISCIGLREKEILKQDINYKKSIFPFSANSKSFIEDEIEGFIKVLASKDKILGVHIIGSHSDYLIQQAAVAMANDISPEDFTEVVFSHPSASEALHETFLGLDKGFLHLFQ